MSNKIKQLYFLFLLIFVTAVVPTAFSQTAEYATLNRDDSKEIWFDQAVSLENSGLVNGPEYYIPFRGATSHPFFQFNDGTKGRVYYNKNQFVDVRLLYDIFTDNLILKYQRKDGFLSLVQLEKARIDSFTVYDHHFRKYDINDPQARLSPGFYDVLYGGRSLTLVAKRAKETHVISTNRVEYEQEDLYYLIDGGRWNRVKGKSSFYQVLGGKEQNKKLSAFIRANRIRIGQKQDADLRKIASFCQSLRQSK